MSEKDVKTPLPKGGVRKRDILEVALELAANRGEDTVAYDISKKSPLVTYTIITSAASDKRAQSLAYYAREALEERGYRVDHIEGKRGSAWILVDAGHILVNVFTREERERFKLEDLYTGCPHTVITDEDVKAYVTRATARAETDTESED